MKMLLVLALLLVAVGCEEGTVIRSVVPPKPINAEELDTLAEFLSIPEFHPEDRSHEWLRFWGPPEQYVREFTRAAGMGTPQLRRFLVAEVEPRFAWLAVQRWIDAGPDAPLCLEAEWWGDYLDEVRAWSRRLRPVFAKIEAGSGVEDIPEPEPEPMRVSV